MNRPVALVALLRSPAVGVPDAALLPLWAGDLPRLLCELDGPDPEALAKIREVAELLQIDHLLDRIICEAGDKSVTESNMDEGNNDDRNDAIAAHLLVSISHSVASLHRHPGSPGQS